MTYVQSQLLPSEQVKYRAHLSWILFMPVYLLGALTLITGTGGTHAAFQQIAAPLEFGKHVQAEAIAAGRDVPPT